MRSIRPACSNDLGPRRATYNTIKVLGPPLTSIETIRCRLGQGDAQSDKGRGRAIRRQSCCWASRSRPLGEGAKPDSSAAVLATKSLGPPPTASATAYYYHAVKWTVRQDEQEELRDSISRVHVTRLANQTIVREPTSWRLSSECADDATQTGMGHPANLMQPLIE